MTPTPLPLTRELVLIGGGHAHALLLRRWGMDPLPGVRLTLINPAPSAPYTGMLPGHIAGHYAREALEIDLVRLARFAGARLILGGADGIDLARKRITVAGRGEVAYDIASLDIGITSDPPDLPGFATHGIAAKPLGPYANRWAAFLEAGAPGDVAVIGGGIGGIELAMAMAHALKERGKTRQVAVIEAATALPGSKPQARAALLDRLGGLGVTLLEETAIASVTAESVVLGDGREVASGFTTGVAGARPQDWLAGTGLDLTGGFVTVDAQLRSVSDPSLYAVGDCAHFSHAPRPKAGVYAVRAAPVLTHNLRADLAGGQRRSFRPQADFLKIVSLGGKAALAEKWGRVVAGPAVWRWKDRIDRRFMDRLADLPAMPPPALPRIRAKGMEAALGPKPLCGGCGAKVGGGVLNAVLADLPAMPHPDLLTAPGDDAAVLQIGGVRQVLSTDHLRAVTEDPHLMARIAAVHALGDIWAMGAEPQAALASIVLPRMAPAMQEAWLAEIMAGAAEVFAAEGVAIAGGHTSLGAEMTIGFTVTGLAPEVPITLSGARPGDALILTRPLGSGTVLAGEMALAARGDDVAAVLAEMARPQGAAAGCLRGAHAMTDVTGFGLAGHLMGMLDASGVAARLRLEAVPLYPGAEALAAAGIRSTLYPANREVAGRMRLPEGPKASLLFDPQTSGGLLAAVAGEAAEEVLKALSEAGHPSALIGEVVAGAPFVEVT